MNRIRDIKSLLCLEPSGTELKTERVSREQQILPMHEQIDSLILIHAMTIHYDMYDILYLCSLHNNIILHCNPLIFYICYVCVLPAYPCVCCGPPEVHFILKRSLNKIKKLHH